jgi:hypothetical protein
MNRSEFEEYLKHFNNRNYKRVKEYFSDNIVLKFAGYTINGKKSFDDFYRSFHQYVNERVSARQFAGDDENVIIDAIVRLEGKRRLSRSELEEKGFGRLALPEPGRILEIPQLIHYRIESGSFVEIRCVLKQ